MEESEFQRIPWACPRDSREFTSLWNYWHATFSTLFIYSIYRQRIRLTATLRWGSVLRACHKQYTFVRSGLAREWKKETGWHNPLYRAKCQDAYEERKQLLPMTLNEEPFCRLMRLTEVKSSDESSLWGNPLETTRGINKGKSRELKKQRVSTKERALKLHTEKTLQTF